MTAPAPAFLKLNEVVRRTGLSRSTVYNRVQDGSFPQPVKLGIRAIGFVESEVSDYIEARIASHRSVQPAQQSDATRKAA